MLENAEYHEPPEVASQDFPFVLITGRTLYHFHTRTKTARAPQLDAAAPEVWVELAEQDARDRDIHEGDLLEVTTRRGSVTARARITGLRSGVIFVPFHYGYWDSAGNAGHARAANELTPTAWDPASKQPIFKSGAARIRRIGGVRIPAPAPTTTASAPVGNDVPATTGGPTALVSESADERRPR
jgi:anaerobic selenocysteine-containing dehydrogenase